MNYYPIPPVVPSQNAPAPVPRTPIANHRPPQQPVRSTSQQSLTGTEIKQNFYRIDQGIKSLGKRLADFEKDWLRFQQHYTGFHQMSEERHNEFAYFKRHFVKDCAEIESKLESIGNIYQNVSKRMDKIESQGAIEELRDESTSELPVLHKKIDDMMSTANAAKEKLDKFDSTAVIYEKAIVDFRHHHDKISLLEHENQLLKIRLERLEDQTNLTAGSLPNHKRKTEQERRPVEEQAQPILKRPKSAHTPSPDVATLYTDLVKHCYRNPPGVDWARATVINPVNKRHNLLRTIITKARWFLSEDKVITTSRGTFILKEYQEEFCNKLRERCPIVTYNRVNYSFCCQENGNVSS